MHLLASFSQIDPVPWANGAGQTTELVSLAASASLTPDLSPWRLSIAGLEAPGPFSALPGMARTFLPTAEVSLRIDAQTHRVPALSTLRFDGDQDVSLRELARPCWAVNLMVSDEQAGLTMTVDTGPVDEEALFALTLAPTREVERFELFALDAGATLPDSVPIAVLTRRNSA